MRLSEALERILSIYTDISEENEYSELVLWLLANVSSSEYCLVDVDSKASRYFQPQIVGDRLGYGNRIGTGYSDPIQGL